MQASHTPNPPIHVCCFKNGRNPYSISGKLAAMYSYPYPKKQFAPFCGRATHRADFPPPQFLCDRPTRRLFLTYMFRVSSKSVQVGGRYSRKNLPRPTKVILALGDFTFCSLVTGSVVLLRCALCLCPVVAATTGMERIFNSFGCCNEYKFCCFRL